MAKEKRKKRRASESDSPIQTGMVDSVTGEVADIIVEDDLNEPTMGEKLATLNLIDENKLRAMRNKNLLPC
ncbi:WD repeat-containing protein 43 [Quillaja saponaria]|uniref:WD repeat-containing protein 43 n=1 Tax=Quillaja saponaria TaxID=32244 RepID=A0AAD7PE81_QUISA|nr:WD repeat-containing protein 43 [Quillaja saponaria]